jgi:2-polyprenyl-6-methoxyphenol hydroxylase-like FAD-dependent oxidoreductase
LYVSAVWLTAEVTSFMADPQVLIVGAGPVGLTAACETVRFGLSTRIIDKNERATDKSKALVLWPRSLELLDRMGPGCTERFIAAGLKAEGATILAGKDEIGRADLTHIDSPYNFVLMIAQSETERLLEEHLRTLGVRVERQTELKDFDATTENVSCTVAHADGRAENVQTSWLIGCDGAHSTVRHRLGMEFHGETLLSDWTLADLHLKGVEGPPQIRIYWHADGVLALFPMEAARFRIIADVGESHGSIGEGHRPPPTVEDVQHLLDVRGPGGLQAYDPVWLSSFSINERKVSDYRAGHVFVGGDAAHLHSPAGGQGMNTGMQDVINLAWKLALVARGHCVPEPLLSSYSSERSALAKLLLEATGKATAMAVLRGGVKQSIRNHVASWILGLPPVQHTMADVLSELSVEYPESPLNETSTHAPSGPKPGKRAPVRAAEPSVGAGDTPRFALFAEAAAAPPELLQHYKAILEPRLRSPFQAGGMWLVRPDGYVAVATRSGDWPAIQRYLQKLSKSSA